MEQNPYRLFFELLLDITVIGLVLDVVTYLTLTCQKMKYDKWTFWETIKQHFVLTLLVYVNILLYPTLKEWELLSPDHMKGNCVNIIDFCFL